jgi:hypothetical protein
MHTTGFLMHSVLTASTEGVPLGVLSAEMWTRAHEDFGKAAERKKKAFADKESSRWLRAGFGLLKRHRKLLPTAVQRT